MTSIWQDPEIGARERLPPMPSPLQPYTIRMAVVVAARRARTAIFQACFIGETTATTPTLRGPAHGRLSPRAVLSLGENASPT